MPTEGDYYRNVAVWLEKKGYYIGRTEPNDYTEEDLFIRKGRKKAQTDVVGIKNTGRKYFDEIEIAIIEVKHENKARCVSLRDITQASSYQIYGHNCYLAVTDKISITPESRNDASNRGLGLLKVPFDFYKKKESKIEINDVEIILTPNKKTPDRVEMIGFCAKLDILQCTLCGCFFNSWIETEEEFDGLPPKNSPFKRLERNKIFNVFPDLTQDQFATKHKQRRSKMWRHICLPCVEDLSRLYGLEKMKKDISKLKTDMALLKKNK